MLARIDKVWDNEDASGQDYKVCMFVSESGKKLKASSWNQKQFNLLVEGKTVDVSITKTSKGNKDYYNIGNVTEVEDFDTASKSQSKARDEGGYGQSIGNSRTSAHSTLDIALNHSVIDKPKSLDSLAKEICYVTEIYFRNSLKLKANAIAGVYKEDEQVPGPTDEGEVEVESKPEVIDDFPDEVPKDPNPDTKIPF